MAKCDLTIELDDPDRVYLGGETITGVVRVHCDTDVSCKALEVKSVWRTHGQGNVDSGEAETKILFSGQWTAGESPEYQFELSITEWPPSYHGHYLNVDHYVDARAMIPWGIDPKASVPFVMRPSCGTKIAKAVRTATNAAESLARWLAVRSWSCSSLFCRVRIRLVRLSDVWSSRSH